MTLERTDAHCPSKIEPDDYQFVCFEHVKDQGFEGIGFVAAQRKILQDHMARTGGTYSSHEHRGNCMICGNGNAIYTILFYHAKTNSYIRCGQDCAEKLSYSSAEFNAFRARFQDAINARAGKAKARAVLERIDMVEALDVTLNDDGTPTPFEERTIVDLVDKLVKYGELSEKQMLFLGNLLDQIKRRPQIEEQRRKEAETAEDCPIGRIEMTGVVLSIKTYEDDYGVHTKVLVKTDRGFKVYGSRFSNCNKGDRVTFKGTLERSEKDCKFGFFKRPHAIKIIDSEGNQLFPEV